MPHRSTTGGSPQAATAPAWMSEIPPSDVPSGRSVPPGPAGEPISSRRSSPLSTVSRPAISWAQAGVAAPGASTSPSASGAVGSVAGWEPILPASTTTTTIAISGTAMAAASRHGGSRSPDGDGWDGGRGGVESLTGHVGTNHLGTALKDRRGDQRCTTGQVSVRVMPETLCTRATTSLPSSSTLLASARTITSYGPVTSSALVTPGNSAIALATAAA